MSNFLFEAVTFSNNHKASIAKKIVSICLIFLSIIIIGYWFDLRELQKEFHAQRHIHFQLQQQVSQLEQQIAAFNRQQSDLIQLQKQINDVHQQISGDNNNQAIINTL